jgi:hypothetical protein
MRRRGPPEKDRRPSDTSLDYRLDPNVPRDEAAAFIKRYEWLGTVGHPIARYGARCPLTGELAAVALFARPAMGNAARLFAGNEQAAMAGKIVCLERGASAYWAHPNTASWFITLACRDAFKRYGWQVFYAYSDTDAGEIGTVYQAANWLYIGSGNGRRKTARSRHKHKYVHIEGNRRERRRLLKELRWPPQPYPKRECNTYVRPDGNAVTDALRNRGYILHSAPAGRHRTPYVPTIATPDMGGLVDTDHGSFCGPLGNGWKRAHGRLTRADYVQAIPPRACDLCGGLFIAKRSDAKTCSVRCRVALSRKRRNDAA